LSGGTFCTRNSQFIVCNRLRIDLIGERKLRAFHECNGCSYINGISSKRIVCIHACLELHFGRHFPCAAVLFTFAVVGRTRGICGTVSPVAKLYNIGIRGLCVCQRVCKCRGKATLNNVFGGVRTNIQSQRSLILRQIDRGLRDFYNAFCLDLGLVLYSGGNLNTSIACDGNAGHNTGVRDSCLTGVGRSPDNHTCAVSRSFAELQRERCAYGDRRILVCNRQGCDCAGRRRFAAFGKHRRHQRQHHGQNQQQAQKPILCKFHLLHLFHVFPFQKGILTLLQCTIKYPDCNL